MLTFDADDPPLMSRMHKPDPKSAPDRQDKRSVVAIEPRDVVQKVSQARTVVAFEVVEEKER